MKVVCNNKYQSWCPYGTKNCECEDYNERRMNPDEKLDFTCIDNDAEPRKCHLARVPENEKELKISKFVDTILSGKDFSYSVKTSGVENCTLQELAEELEKREYSDVGNKYLLMKMGVRLNVK